MDALNETIIRHKVRVLEKNIAYHSSQNDFDTVAWLVYLVAAKVYWELRLTEASEADIEQARGRMLELKTAWEELL